MIPAIQSSVEEVARRYMFRDRDEVRAFLDAHPFLVPLLIEASKRIPEYFPDAPVALDVVHDNESDDVQLFVLILTPLEANEASDRLDRLDADWWLGASVRARGSLGLDVEFA